MKTRRNTIASPEILNFQLVWKSLGKLLIRRIVIFSFLFVALCLIILVIENGKNIFDNLFQKIFLFLIFFGLSKIYRSLNKKPKDRGLLEKN